MGRLRSRRYSTLLVIKRHFFAFCGAAFDNALAHERYEPYLLGMGRRHGVTSELSGRDVIPQLQKW